MCLPKKYPLQNNVKQVTDPFKLVVPLINNGELFYSNVIPKGHDPSGLHQEKGPLG